MRLQLDEYTSDSDFIPSTPSPSISNPRNIPPLSAPDRLFTQLQTRHRLGVLSFFFPFSFFGGHVSCSQLSTSRAKPAAIRARVIPLDLTPRHSLTVYKALSALMMKIKKHPTSKHNYSVFLCLHCYSVGFVLRSTMVRFNTLCALLSFCHWRDKGTKTGIVGFRWCYI